ncbi:MAG: CDP-glycerol glycerophosphotransferase family protein [Oscillospiraceae bacterium]|nr:CDP-glycerol glycerophosphotransferase family protein [Oscillospiraceae bacterium]
MKNKVEENIIVFEAFKGAKYDDSPKAIYEELLKDIKYSDFIFVWAFQNTVGVDDSVYLERHSSRFLQNPQTIIVEYGSNEYYKYCSKTKYFITNSLIPEAIIKKKEQIFVQAWHGTPLKRLGYDMNRKGTNVLNSVKEWQNKYKNDAKKYTYMLSPSKYCTEKFTSAFNLKKLHKNNIIIEEGYPRNDFLHNATASDIERIKDELGIEKDKKVILYAPTWRDNQHKTGLGYTYDLNIDFEKMREKLKDEYVVLFRTHSFIANTFDFKNYEGFILNLSEYNDITHLYVITDILITDYSSVFFDYANLGRPILFYMYDLDHYNDVTRGFYIDLEELPGPISKTEDELIKDIINIEDIEKEYEQKYQKFNDKFTYLDDGQASRRVIERINIGGKNE